MNAIVTPPTELKIAWSPLPGSQSLGLACPANHILMEGTRGPGKTETQLARFRSRVGMGYKSYWRGIIFDREYKNLDDIVAKGERFFNKFNDGSKFIGGSSYKWVWPSGEELLLRAIKRPNDYYNYHGQEFPFIGWNELTKYPTSELYDAMMSCNRSSFLGAEHFTPTEELTDCPPQIPLEVFSTTNPHGPGHMWVKRRFIDPAPPGKLVRNTRSVFNPRTQTREPITKTQVRIFGSYKENRYLAPEYILELESIRDENKRKAWLWGDWDIAAGGVFEDLWGPYLIVPRFKIPRGWRIDRSFDWGSSHPFSVGWWCEANGEEVTFQDGTKRAFPAGSLIRFAEWYGTREIGTNEGLKLTAKKIALGIAEREKTMRENGWIPKGQPVLPGPADNQIYDKTQQGEDEVESIAKKMEDQGITWERSDKSPGSRKNGLEVIRELFGNVKDGEGPGMYFTENCKAAISTVPLLPRDEYDPDDVDTTAEDHPYDEIRYRALKGNNRIVEKLNVRMVR